MTYSGPSIVLGTAGFAFFSIEIVKEMLHILEKHNISQLDTAASYPGSEKVLGNLGAPGKFAIQTKAAAFRPGALAKLNVLDSMAQSLKDMGTDSVDIYYLHAPDPTIAIEETLSAIQELYRDGKFKRFGLSNFTAPDVQKIYDIQAAASSVLPTVFQGNYNAIARHIEKDLFPLLHKLKISFYAYSPIAGGFLVKESMALRHREDTGRFRPNMPLGDMYMTLYGKESMFAAVDEWSTIAKDAGITKAALAYRWIAFHSSLERANGDAIVVGASKSAQLEETLIAVEAGPLPEKIAERASAIWEQVKDDAPLDNYNSFIAHNGLPPK